MANMRIQFRKYVKIVIKHAKHVSENNIINVYHATSLNRLNY